MNIDPINPPRLHGELPGSARFKSQPTDFQVEEILGFEPSGEGEHCFLWVEKTDRNSNDIAGHFADRLGIRKRLISHCGLKDKHAVTRQWFSLHLPGAASPQASDLETEGVRILKITRNLRKLRRGSHDGNRFTIRLRNCTFTAEQAELRWQKIITQGVPNYFGSQRFGKRGDNIRQAKQMFAGQLEIRDRLLRGLIISAARSYLFNAIVAERLRRGIWDQVIDGEVFGFPDNRSLILPDNLRHDEPERVAAGQVDLTAPLWGKGEPPSLAEVLSLEKEIAAGQPELVAGLEELNLRQERRTIRLLPKEPSTTWESDADLILKFDLPKGTYATTILREFADIIVEFPPGGA